LVSDTATLAPHLVSPQEAADRAALEHLAAAYCHAIDRRDYKLLRALYHDDAIDNHAPFYTGPVDGFVAWLPAMMAAWDATSHVIAGRLYLIDGDYAEGELAAKAYHRTLDGGREFIAHGRYVDRYERRLGIWKFSYRALVLDWTEDRAIEARADFGTTGAALGRAGPDDPCYEHLPRLREDRATRVL
jgi:hypothetical protein